MDHVNEAAERPMVRVDTAETEPQYVRVPLYAASTALRQAEQAVGEIVAKLRDAEAERDDLARKLGAQQDMIDRLSSEREYRTRHVRALTASVEVGREHP